MDCLFCKIVAGKIPATKVFEDAHCIGFMDINPGTEGHCLVVPKTHAENIFDIAPDLTVPDIVGGTLFSVTGSLTRTGSMNPLYQWTGFFTGTRFRSAAFGVATGAGFASVTS